MISGSNPVLVNKTGIMWPKLSSFFRLNFQASISLKKKSFFALESFTSGVSI